jgi:KipI family sensor histidine kinase inhibitor
VAYLVADYICHEYGDSGILVDFTSENYEERWRQTQALGNALRESSAPGLIDVVATYQNVFVSFNPLLASHDFVKDLIESLIQSNTAPREAIVFKIPIVYGQEFGPHLEFVANVCELTQTQFIELHSGEDWKIRFVGSPVGAPFLDGPKIPVSIPRLTTPLTRMVPGSVALSGFQSIIYNAPSPGGWQVVGRTPVQLFDLNQNPPVPYSPGDRIRFKPISESEWNSWNKAFHGVEL